MELKMPENFEKMQQLSLRMNRALESYNSLTENIKSLKEDIEASQNNQQKYLHIFKEAEKEWNELFEPQKESFSPTGYYIQKNEHILGQGFVWCNGTQFLGRDIKEVAHLFKTKDDAMDHLIQFKGVRMDEMTSFEILPVYGIYESCHTTSTCESYFVIQRADGMYLHKNFGWTTDLNLVKVIGGIDKAREIAVDQISVSNSRFRVLNLLKAKLKKYQGSFTQDTHLKEIL